MPYSINQRAHQFNSIQSVQVSFGLWDTALKSLSPGPRSDVTDHLVVHAYPESNVMGDEESDLMLRSPWLPRTGEICKLVNDSEDSWKEEERNECVLVISLFIFKL